MRSLHFLFLLSISLSSAFSADLPKLTSSQLTQLNNGGVVILKELEDCPYTKGGRYVTGVILMKETQEKVWSVLNDPETAPEYLDEMVSAKILSRDSQSILIEQGMKVKGFRTPFQYVVRMYPKGDHLTFKMESGKLRAFDGGWWLIPTEGGTFVVYSLHLDPGRLAPQSIVKKSLQKKIPETLVAVRGEVGKRF